VGTQNGLNVLDLETGLVKKKFFKTDGLNSNRINALEKDKKDGVWILTSEGLSRINTQKGIISAYSKENNLYTHNTGLLTHEDEVLVSAELSGFYKFKATDIKTNPVPPPVHIISIKINGIPLDDAKLNNEMLKLNHNESSIEFEFTALNYLSPEKNRYKYKLEGFDNAWKTTGADKRFATYTNLSPGDYAFRVLGSNNNGVWNQPGDTFEFTILPPWWRAPWAITMFLILFVSTLFLLWLIRKKMSLMKQKNEKAILQHEMDENQLHFFTNISHEIRTPLSLISTPIENILETTELNEDVKTKLLLVKNNTVKLQSLIDQLLDFRKLKVGAYRMKPENLDIVKYVNHVFQIFKPLFTKNHIYFTYYCQTKSRIIFVDPEVLDRILNNLLSNALKNTPHDGNVKMELHVFPESYMINVCNTGKGLEQKEFNKIFTRFYQGENKNNIKQGGFGIGLSVAKQYVDYLNGKIEVNETSNNETRFSILLPITEPVEETGAHFPVEERPAEILETTVQKEYIDQDEANDKLGKLNLASDITDKKIILIVEDNSDLRVLLSNIFIYDFTILEALNGQEGLEKARNVIPDVIISDIMMPVMDGLTFCEKCKEDDLISHVPIILLTAKADMDSRITGIKTGADAYINKPFNKKELLSQVENLISNRELLQKKYQKRLLIPHQKPGVENSKNTIKNFISPKNEEFIDKVKSIIEDNYHLETFNTDMLAKRILFTRQYLHRKFSGLTGLTPSQYIKEYRLNKARELLNSDKRLTVSEIVYKCGFKSISHFSRSYKEKFGKNPSE
jgi:signal transduction histidine kinase/DNA-binding response OmpR family regulator